MKLLRIARGTEVQAPNFICLVPSAAVLDEWASLSEQLTKGMSCSYSDLLPIWSTVAPHFSMNPETWANFAIG
jgi:hypothetical protein